MLNETYRAMLNNKSVIRETFMYGRQRAAQIGSENVFDYSLGNPSVPCPPEFTEAMQTLLAQEEPVSLHGYCPSQGDPGFRTAVAAHLTETFDLPYAQKHIFPTTGAAGAIAHAIRAVTQPGDEVLTFAPYFPEYGPYVAGTGAVLRVVPPQAPTFQPNLDAFAQMLTEKVTCVLINTPNNPTGVVYSADTLTRMAAILTQKSAQYGHNIFLVSDEPYRDIVFDGKTVPYPAAFYPHTLTCFSYSKSLSLPGERLGYVAVRPGCEGEDILVDMMSQISRFTGHNCPPSIIQRAVSRCQRVTSDLSVYQTNMELLYEKLTALGFEVERPGGTFYIFPKALEEDANAFCQKAREFDLLLVPSDSFGVKGYVRLAYCIDTEKVKRSLPAFEKLVEMDGDEMTRILWKMIKDELILPFVDLKTEYYDLGLPNRDATADQVTMDAALANKKYGVSVKCATITPNAQRVEEYKLHEMWKSPNGTIRAVLDGTVFRAPIMIDSIHPVVKNWKKPITIARHAYGDVYKCTEFRIPGAGKAELVFTGADGSQQRATVFDFEGAGVLQGQYNKDDSIRSFARSCFNYALDVKQDLWFGAKDTISKKYDHTFKDIFQETYDAEYKEKFEAAGITYFYSLIDDIVARVIRSEGGFVWACKNYDGDVMSDMVSTAFGSLAMMTSVLVSPDGKYEYEAAHGTVTRHYYKYLKGEKTSTNPMATIFAWSGAFKKRGELDNLPELVHFGEALEAASLQTLNEGIMTKDLCGLAEGITPTAVDSEGFIKAIRERLEAKLA